MKKFSILILFCVISLLTTGCASLKVTDPTDPRFDESQFRFEDYAEFKKFRTAMEAMLPVGTPKQKIDHMLVDIGGAGMADDGIEMKIARSVDENERIVRYYKKNNSGILNCTFKIAAVFDNSNILSKEIDASYGCK